MKDIQLIIVFRGNCGKVKLGLDEITHKYYAVKIANKDKLK